MSRKNDAFNDKMNIGYTESEETDTAALGGEIVDDEINDGEETVDISQFSAAPPHIPTESEEGKKVARLIESLLIDAEPTPQSTKGSKAEKPPKPKKEKTKKDKKGKRGFGLFSSEPPSDEDYEFFEEEVLDSDTHDEAPSKPPQAEQETAEDDNYDDNTYPDAEDEQKTADDYDNYDDYEDIDDGYEYEDEESEGTSDPSSPDAEAAQPQPDHSRIDDVTNGYQDYEEPEDEPYPYELNHEQDPGYEKSTPKHPLLQKLKAFWTTSEDFEEKFDDDFDPSVFDEDEPSNTSEQAAVENEAESDIPDAQPENDSAQTAEDDRYIEYEQDEYEDEYDDEYDDEYAEDDEAAEEQPSAATGNEDTEDDSFSETAEEIEVEPIAEAEYEQDEYEDEYDYEYDDEYTEDDEAAEEQRSAATENEDTEGDSLPETDEEIEPIAEAEYEQDEYDEYAEDAEYETEQKPQVKKMSLFGKLKALWQGDDLSGDRFNEEIDEEDTDDDFHAAGEDDKSQWGKSDLSYDDLSEYAPKSHSSSSETQLDEDSLLDEEENELALEERPRRSIIDTVKDTVKAKFKTILDPTIADSTDEDNLERPEDTEYSSSVNETGEVEQDEIKPVKASKPSPIDHFKNFWNDDGDYADEDDEDEDEEPVDADFSDKQTAPVSKPVLKVIHPYDKQDEEADNKPDEKPEVESEDDAQDSPSQSATSTQHETTPSQAAAVAASSADISSEDEDEIIAEGPDAPDDVYSAPSHRARKNIFSKLKKLWSAAAGKDKPTPALSEEKQKLAAKVKAGAQHAIEDEQLSQRSDEPSSQPPTESSDVTTTKPETPKAEENPQTEAESEPAATVEKPEQQPIPSESEQLKSGPEVPTFDDIAQDKTVVDNLDGKQVVDGKVIPDYTHEDRVEKINLTNENLAMVVRREYEEYIKQAKYKPKASEIVAPEVNSEVSRAVKEEMRNPEAAREKAQQKLERSAERAKQERNEEKHEEKRPRRSLKDILFGEVENSADFSEFRAQTNQSRQTEQVIEDYDKPSDARAVRAEINYDNRKISFRCIALTAIFLITLVLFIIQRYFPTLLTDNIPNADIMTCLLSMILLLVSAVLCHSTVLGGLKPLLTFKGNSDTAAAVAVAGCIIQGAVSFFDPQSFFSGGMHLYSILAIAALLLNSLGKMCIVQRIRDNFRFVSSPNRKYSARIFDDEEISKEMISKTEAGNPVVALQSRTRFLKGFLRFSYMPDPSERAASIMAPITTVIAVLIAIICGISTGSAAGAVSSFSIVACMSVPMCCLLAINIPMKKLCDNALKNRAMIVGYPAVKHFSDTRAVMVDSRELYPRGKVELLSVKTFNTYNIDKALLNAAAVMKIANTPMTYMFEDVISEKGEQLPEVESVKYEDGKGLVSWVGGERLLLGNRDLMTKYSINLPSLDFEEASVKSRTNCITYLANAGQLVAMLVTDYQPDKRLAAELKRLEDNGVTILIRTADPNVSQLKVAKDYRIYMRSIKILPTVLGNICKDEMSRRDESSKALLATEGKLHSLARALGGCIKIRSNFFISIVIQIIGVALGVLIAGAVSLFSGLNGLSGVDLLLYVLFWTVATIIAPLIQKA